MSQSENNSGARGLRAGAVAMVVLLAACANSAPVVDRQNIDEARYQRDLKECQSYAGEVSTASAAGKSALAGAAVGAVVGAIVGNSGTVARSAGVGGTVAGAQGAVQGENEKGQVVKNCLRGRGYKVLN